MPNPFRKRATEYISEPVALLPLVSQRPIGDFLSKDAEAIFEKLTVIVGSPGCGKTTIARVMEYDCLFELSQNPDHNKALTAVLHDHEVLVDGRPGLLAHLLPMTSDFRAIWELPYTPQLKSSLLRSFVQSKAVLGWFRRLVASGVALSDIEVLTRRDTESASVIHQAQTAESFRDGAREIEMAIFKIVTALVAPNVEDLPKEFLDTRYDVFEFLTGFRLGGQEVSSGGSWTLKPLVIIDDAHELHPNQYVQLRDWLKSRVIGVSRWIMCRPDVVAPEDFREVLVEDNAESSPLPAGSSRGRDYILRLMQLSSRETKKFRPVARDIANNYLRSMPEISNRVSDVERLLATSSMSVAAGQIRHIREAIASRALESKFGDGLLKALEERIPASADDDERAQTLRILIERERNRTPQLALIEPEPLDEPVSDDRQARADVVDGARIQLLHEYRRPYYYGLEKLADASNANIEQFITLCGALVDVVAAQVVRGKPISLKARIQNDTLQKKARDVMSEWDFPYHVQVRELVELIAKRCLEVTLKPNAPLSDGANAVGVPQSEFDQLHTGTDRLARVLHFAFAYKALNLVPHYRCKNKDWCLLELGGIPCLAFGLTLGRGGFIEDRLSGLQSSAGW